MRPDKPFHIHVQDEFWVAIEVSEDGRRWRRMKPEQLPAELEPLKGVEGAFVAYSRSSQNERQASKGALSILQMIGDAGLPIRLVMAKGSLAAVPRDEDEVEAEPDGELSYTNCLLLTLAKGRSSEATIHPNRPLPNLVDLTNDPDERAWTLRIPFNYEELNGDLVIEVLQHNAYYRPLSMFKGVQFMQARLIGTEQHVKFKLSRTKSPDGAKQLRVERVEG